MMLYIAPCVDPGVPSYGRRLGSHFGHEKTVTFQCNPRYTLVGIEIIRCQDGVWSGHLPQCKGSTLYSSQNSFALHNMFKVEIRLKSVKLKVLLYVPE